MNKYTKNIIFFNLEKIIALITVLSIVILTLFCMNSCTSTKYTYHKNYPCPTFKNARI